MLFQYLLAFFGGVLFALAIFLMILGASDVLVNGDQGDINWPIDHPRHRRKHRDNR